jgi:hypothetical protein
MSGSEQIKPAGIGSQHSPSGRTKWKAYTTSKKKKKSAELLQNTEEVLYEHFNSIYSRARMHLHDSAFGNF